MISSAAVTPSIGVDRFAEITSALSELVADGYVKNQRQINNLMAEGIIEDCFLRQFFAACVVNPTHRGLCSSQSFALHICAEYVLRINLWMPSGRFSDFVNKIVDDYYSIDVCHNHTFDFFTVGAFGPGYDTDFFSTSRHIRDAKVGDVIEPDHNWSFRLRKGMALFVPSGSHFHVQHAPESFSVSINLIPTEKPEDPHPQLILCEDNRTVRKVVGGRS